MNVRRIISIILVFSFILLLITGVVLYVVPVGRIAYWADWKFLGLTKEQWGSVHIISGILGLAAGFVHIFYNWKAIVQYLKNRKKELRFFNINFNIALLVTLLCLVGTFLEVPPFSYILNFSEEIKDSAIEEYGEPPYSHAELSTIKQFCETMQIDLNEAIDNLKVHHINFSDEDDVLKDIAANNNVSPQQLYVFMKVGTESNIVSIPDLPPAGTGKKSLKTFCKQYNLNLIELIDYLAKQKILVNEDMTLVDIANQKDIEMIELYNIIKSFAKSGQ